MSELFIKETYIYVTINKKTNFLILRNKRNLGINK